MTTEYQIVKDYLEREPRARERRNRDNAIANLLLERYGNLNDKKVLMDALRLAKNLDRHFRAVQADYPELRGTDYDTKDVVESEYIYNKLKYEPRFHENVKKLKTL